jgi:hypothetical protein
LLLVKEEQSEFAGGNSKAQNLVIIFGYHHIPGTAKINSYQQEFWRLR